MAHIKPFKKQLNREPTREAYAPEQKTRIDHDAHALSIAYTPLMDTKRFVEITEEIDALLVQPLPPPAEKHLLREKIFALKYEQLGLSGDMPEPEQDQLARDFTLAKVPQNIFSYPMLLRETPMPVRRDYLKEYASSPTSKAGDKRGIWK